jgi:hypothetical protein
MFIEWLEKENRDYGHRDPLRWPRDTLYPQILELTSPTRGGRLVGIVRSQTQATEFSLVYPSFVLNLNLVNQETFVMAPCVS